MTDYPVLWIVICAFLSLALAWFQYYYRPQPLRYRIVVAGLRFLAVFGLLLLLLNPKIERTRTFLEKHRLVVLLDNTASIQGADRELVQSIGNQLRQEPEFADRFDVDAYAFGTGLYPADSLDFLTQGTDISAALQRVEQAVSSGLASVVLVSDGVENQGRSYQLTGSEKLPVYPVVIGDTTRYRDLRVDQINVNRYAFLGNQYPVEILLSHSGDIQASTTLELLDNGRRVYRESIRLNNRSGTRQVLVNLQASEVGLHRLEARLEPLEGERNVENNRSQAALEVVDEQTLVFLVSNQNHPDLGAFRRSIEVNEQRRVLILDPAESLSRIDESDLLILFQPDMSFTSLYEALSARDLPVITVAGPLTDWDFLNNAQSVFQLIDEGPGEDLLPVMDPGFGYFDLTGWDVSDYPPLNGRLGSPLIGAEHQVLLEQRVRGVDLGEPLLALVRGRRREALLFGSGIWKWRLSTYRNSGEFTAFDDFVGKMMLFLTAEGSNKRLTLDYSPLFEDSGNALIRARFFNESFELEPDASLNIQLTDSTGQGLGSRPMVFRGGYFEADVGNLAPGTYRFTVQASGTPFSESGQFSLQAFNLENQQIPSDAGRLSELARSSGGAVYFPDNFTELKDTLLQSERFRPVQKSRRNIVPLVDYRWLLFGIVLCLAAEWFLRKYNGLL